MKPLTICDSTLRDGSHAMRHTFSVDDVRSVTRALDGVGMPVIEVSHGDGLGGSSFNYGLSEVDELALIATSVETATNARIAVLLLPGIGTTADLRAAAGVGASVARIATHCTEADISVQHLALARDLGMTAVGFLMMSHMSDADRLAQQALVMAEAGAEVVYVVDSAGALLPATTAARVEALRAALPAEVEIGFHGHHNLGMAVANSLAAVEHGATWLDASTCGFGAGAGNAPSELLVAVLDKSGVATGIDCLALLSVADDVVRPLLPRPLVADRPAAVLGYAGVYSSFLLHAEQAGERFGIDPGEILLEVGRRKAVGGQEDLVLEVAATLAAGSGPARESTTQAERTRRTEPRS